MLAFPWLLAGGTAPRRLTTCPTGVYQMSPPTKNPHNAVCLLHKVRPPESQQSKSSSMTFSQKCQVSTTPHFWTCPCFAWHCDTFTKAGPLLGIFSSQHLLKFHWYSKVCLLSSFLRAFLNLFIRTTTVAPYSTVLCVLSIIYQKS